MRTSSSQAHPEPELSTRGAVPILSIVAFCLLLAATLYAVARYGAESGPPRTPADVAAPPGPGAVWPGGGSPEEPEGATAGAADTDEDFPEVRAPAPQSEELAPEEVSEEEQVVRLAAPSVPSPPDAGTDAEVDAAPAASVPAPPPPPEDAYAGAGPDDDGNLDPEPASGPPCGATTCAPGQVCCNASCGTCVSPGETCSQLVCGMPVVPGSESCGPNTCNVGEVCCNASCGICVSPGETCDQRRCSNEIQYVESQSCGMQTCNVGFVCCNPSCGVCKPPGEPCSQEPC